MSKSTLLPWAWKWFFKILLVLCACVHSLPFTNDILTCLRALCVYILHSCRRSYSKTRALRMTDHRRLPRELPSLPLLSFAFPLCQKGLSFLPEHPFSPPKPSLPLWLERVASECQMYYRVSHGNVNTQPCHESRVVRPPPIFFLFSLPSSADCQRGGESTKQPKEKHWGGGGSEGRSRSIVAVVCLCFGCTMP